MGADEVTTGAAKHTALVEVEYEGRQSSLPFHAEERVDQLRDEAVGRFGLEPAPNEFALLTVDGRELQDHQTLADAGVEPGVRLKLVLKVVQILCNGRTEPFAFRPDETVGKLRETALQTFGVVTQPHLYGLFNEAGQDLNDSLTLRQAGVVPGAMLVLRQSHVRGGSQ